GNWYVTVTNRNSHSRPNRPQAKFCMFSTKILSVLSFPYKSLPSKSYSRMPVKITARTYSCSKLLHREAKCVGTSKKLKLPTKTRQLGAKINLLQSHFPSPRPP
ncbi:unnamed protein product, partial [Sphacelaria rigidula]